MSWSNAAVPAAPDTEYHFPKGKVLTHSSKIDSIDWLSSGPKKESDIYEMTGYFWKTKDVSAFGAFTPSSGAGLYHVADEKIASGIKLWSYGVKADSAWSTLSTARHQPYAEIQGGPIGDQSIKLELQPKEFRSHTEYWFPSDKPLDLYDLQVPTQALRETKEIPLFAWARSEETKIWNDLQNAFSIKSGMPSPPPIDQNLWAPSGMENLNAPFEWAIYNTRGEENALWKFHYGSWLAGTGKTKEAITILSASDHGISKALLSRLYKLKGDMHAARKSLDGIHEKWLQLHPQIVVERDKILRNIGRETIPEREKWLNSVSALQDEWVLERKVQLMIDKGNLKEAKTLLLSIPFQKVHQTYSRTNLWNQLCEKLNTPCLPIPVSLGEDRLATFGAYREFE
jgi:hypothetical protein